ncbi:serine/arginine repetitive matrix protein 1 [Diabrotica virgifera virgifera]|uniref:Serine/arginine repetitive matrix protein 1-like n=1 Tax=Diabrotica virgifera virgifera TaxID=50390 RepID=A0A6P7GX55_DIAVI|nr:serine/arginine repetitive matrix protein 1 [Diabrotica virgifera virgifera]
MNINMVPASDEDDDIESLRRAALHSLKKKHTFSGTQHGFYYPNFRGGRRGSKSGNFNGVRNTNLISLTHIQPVSEANNESPTKEVTVEDGSSKFNRYNKSDRSGSESEDDPLVGINSAANEKKSESLDELMQELDSQIVGEPNVTRDLIRIRSDQDLLEKTNKEGDQPEQSQPQAITVVNMNKTNPIIISPGLEIPGLGQHFSNPAPPGTMRKRPRSRSPFRGNRFRKRQPKFFPSPMVPPQPMMPFIPPEHFQQPLLPFIPPVPEPIFIPQGFNMIPQPAPHPYFERPLSPLAINTESLTTATMAPLSPRSAAFVMKNKAIVEKRRRSPRRSFSRSPSRSLSRSPRRSLSPRRRSVTPPLRRFRRSISPRRFSRSPPRRFSPQRKRSLSPAKRRSNSPKRKATENPPPQNKPPVHNRLGNKSDKPEEKKEISSEKEAPAEIKEEEILDPVLAARKKKFETNEIKKKEGIIRLKPKEDKPKDEEDYLLEESDEEIKDPKEDNLEINLQKEDKLDNISKERKPEVAKKLKEDKPGVIKKPEIKKTITPTTSSVQKKPTTSNSKTTNTTPTTKPTTTSTTSKSAQTESTVSKPNKTEVKKTEEKPKDPVVSPKKIIEDDPDEFKELERLLFDDTVIDEILDHKVEDIFSDEESASDNEGRFKAKEKQGEKKVPVLSFSKLVNGTKPEIKAEPLPDSSKSSSSRYQSRYADRRPRTQPTPKPPSRIEVQKEKEKKEKITAPPAEQKPARQKITLLTEKKTPRPIKQDRKIEIKIKNPSKYEKGSKPKSKAESSVPIQKIIVPIRDDSDDSSDDEEVIIESDESSIDDRDDDISDEETVRGGDLRAQLSRKRAEKLKLPSSAEVSSRLLQYALRGAIFKKAKKKSKKKSLSSSDSKLPIHYRLGLSSPQDFLEDFQVKKKKKRKNRHLLEQV